MRDDIFSLALTLSGAGEQEQNILKLLCSSAEDYWTERLRVPVERCPQSFACAAAFLAAAAWTPSPPAMSPSPSAMRLATRGTDSGAPLKT